MIFAYRLKNKLKDCLRKPWHFLKRLPDEIVLFGARAAGGLLPSVFNFEPSRLYPPRVICKSTIDWVSTTGRHVGASVREVDSSCTVPNPLPKTVHSKIRRQFLIDQAYDYPSTFVAKISGGRVWGDGFVITPDDQLLDDVSVDFRGLAARQSSVSLHWKLQPLTIFDSTVAVLATDGAEIYYHWLLQLLPRLELIRRAGMDLAGIDYFVVNSLKNEFQRETLALLGIDKSQVIESVAVGYLKARELIVPSIPLWGGCFRPWMCEFLRAAFTSKNPDDVKVSGRRLYISRGRAGKRRVLNEGDVVQLLRRRGFEAIALETLSVAQQAATVAACEVIVAPHGGGLSNLIFSSPGTKVVEIFSPELVAAYFWKICNQLNLDYYYLLGKGDPATLNSNYPQSWNHSIDIEVDLNTLEKTLELANVV
jgi:capsular polysaccharide biosynthesis protein